MGAISNDTNMIFFSPGRKGVLFTFPKGFFETQGFLTETVQRLEFETGDPVIWVEDRRGIPRA